MRIYICSVKELTDAASYDAASLKIGSRRQEKLRHIKNEADKRRCVGAGLLLNYALYQFRTDQVMETGKRMEGVLAEAERTEVVLQEIPIKELLEAPTQEFVYREKENGKPFLADEEEFFFSLSHSGEYVLCATASFEIGADLQLCEKEVRQSMAERLLTKQEYESYEALPETERKEAFYCAWTIKESSCKLTGKGLSQVFSQMEILWREKKLLFLKENSSACFLTGSWQDRYRFAVSYYSESILKDRGNITERDKKV